ncbi:MAG TPA: hypothetical protein VN633_02190 [Bryobacteraceae bacterium]|nr:hypothetical protein [Bryobacteraceae bacterium]
MSSYLDTYGAGEERRNKIIKRVAIAVVVAIIVAIAAYLFFDNYPEKQVVKHFLAQVNSGSYQEAYQTWGCSGAHPCAGYDYGKFMEDWGPKANHNKWSISGVDGCKNGVIITVGAQGSEPEPLWVERENKALSFSPWPECQGKQWRFRQFFRRLFGG